LEGHTLFFDEEEDFSSTTIRVVDHPTPTISTSASLVRVRA